MIRLEPKHHNLYGRKPRASGDDPGLDYRGNYNYE